MYDSLIIIVILISASILVFECFFLFYAFKNFLPQKRSQQEKDGDH